MAANDQAKLKKRLEALLKLPENQICADCRKRGPRWASANLGIFICIECSGIHRNLGVHISFVRSVNLDSWTKAQVDFMEEWGNARANEYWEANLPATFNRPKEGDPVRVVERFIRDKYEFRKYVGKEIPPKHANGGEDGEGEHPHDPVARRPSKHHHHHHHQQHHQHHSRHEESHAAAPPAAKPVEAPKPAPQAAAPSLLDFMDEPAAPVAPASNFAASSFVPSNSDPFGPGNGGGGFDAFASPPAAPAVQNNGFPAFDSNPQQQNNLFPPAAPSGFDFVNQQQQQQQPQKPQASADAILSLYSSNMGRGPPMPMAGGFGGPAPMGYPPQPMMNNARPHPGMGGGGGMQAYGQPPMTMGGQSYGNMPYNAPPVNPFAGHQQQPPMGMGMGGGYPGNFPPQFQQQPPQNPFVRPSMPPQYQQQQPNMGMNPNMQYQNWQR